MLFLLIVVWNVLILNPAACMYVCASSPKLQALALFRGRVAVEDLPFGSWGRFFAKCSSSGVSFFDRIIVVSQRIY